MDRVAHLDEALAVLGLAGGDRRRHPHPPGDDDLEADLDVRPRREEERRLALGQRRELGEVHGEERGHGEAIPLGAGELRNLELRAQDEGRAEILLVLELQLADA